MEKKIKMGIVGAGTWGRTHAVFYREHSSRAGGHLRHEP